ncbi:MAG: hypothetical protein JWQ42_2351 [Edaphobacter sp.]|nr:hypothetical protein [Edaphobacter sp.]
MKQSSEGSGQPYPDDARYRLRYEMVKWLSPIPWDYIGTLTFRELGSAPSRHSALNAYFKHLQDRHAMGLCIWVEELGGDGRAHAHFLMTRQELAQDIAPSGSSIAALWGCGFRKVQRFDPAKRGVSYVFKSFRPGTDYGILYVPGSRNAEKLHPARIAPSLRHDLQGDVDLRHRPQSTSKCGGRRECLSDEMRRNLLSAYGRGEGTLAALAAKFGVSLSVVKKIRQQLIHTGKMERIPQHRGPRKLTAALRNSLREWVEVQPTMTVAELQRRMEESFKVRICRSHLSGVLGAMKSTRMPLRNSSEGHGL